MATPMISSPFGFNSRYNSARCGISSTQDGQVVAQNVTSTGLPRAFAPESGTAVQGLTDQRRRLA